MTVQSGLGAAQPVSILILPVLNDGEVTAVIEFGRLCDFEDRELDFLNLIMESIGIAIRTAQSREQVNGLLEESQAQAEELLAGEEELRESNSALKKQTQTLKESEELLRAQQGEMEQANEELEEQRERIELQNTELQEAQSDLEERARELELTSKYKSEFLANMSHELRTPLNSLLILSQLLGANKEGNLTDKQMESITTIHGSGQDLLTLINDILDLSKVEAGMLEFVYEGVNIRSMVESVARSFRAVAEEQELEFDVEMDECLPATMTTDHQRVSQILKNLLTNAFKFTAKGTVLLKVFRPASDTVFSRPGLRAANAVAFAVSDTGLGIAEEKKTLIFDAFKQAEGGTSRKYGGTGLGLSISRQFVEALSGEIQLESKDGVGSTFTLFLPESRSPDLSKETRAIVEPVVLAEQKTAVLTAQAPSQMEQSGCSNRVRDDRREIQPEDKSLLIIEDDVSFAKILADLAREKGFKCVIAEEGETGLRHADYYKPSAIILDIGLPGMDGWGVMNRLKENLDTRHIPVHFMSALDEPRDALQMGAVGYLTKPIGVEELEKAFSTIEDTVGKPVKDLLVAAGDPTAIRHIRNAVGNGDVRCTDVSSGEEACGELKSGNFDCIVIHSPLSDMVGADLLGRLDGIRSVDRVPVVVYSEEDLSAAEESTIALLAEKRTVHSVRSPERLLDETVLFLHRVEANLPESKRKMLRMVHDKESILKGKRILLADDDMRNIFALSAALEDRGMQIITAKNGREALKRLENFPDIDLVLIDIMMPEMDGYEAMAEIRRQNQFKKLPIIALTAKAMKGDRQKCISAGASDYLSKPVDLHKLTSLLRVWLYQ